MSNSSIWPINAITPDQSGPERMIVKAHHQMVVSYQGHLWDGSLSSLQRCRSVYFIDSTNRADPDRINFITQDKWKELQNDKYLVQNLLHFSTHRKVYFVKISATKLVNCYDLEYSDHWPHLYCYTHNVSANISFSFLQVFHVKHRSHHRILNWTL